MSDKLTEKDMDYLRNINTRPGPNAGRSVDSAKLGPDADRIAELERQIAAKEREIKNHTSSDIFSPLAGLANLEWQLKDLRTELARLRNEQPKECPVCGSRCGRTPCWPEVAISAPAPSPAPSPEPQDVRGDLRGDFRMTDDVVEVFTGQQWTRCPDLNLPPANPSPPQDAWGLLERCRTILGNMALENEGGGIFTARWPVHHEPLRSDAKNLLPLIDAALAQSDAQPNSRIIDAYFGASEAAGYHYPGEDQQPLRDAYCRGAAEYAPKQSDAPLDKAVTRTAGEAS